MNKTEFGLLFNSWLDKEAGNLKRKLIGKEDVKAKRTYIHFDKRRQASSLYFYYNIFIDPKKIIRNPFWPFLKRRMEVIKIKNDRENLTRQKKLNPGMFIMQPIKMRLFILGTLFY